MDITPILKMWRKYNIKAIINNTKIPKTHLKKFLITKSIWSKISKLNNLLNKNKINVPVSRGNIKKRLRPKMLLIMLGESYNLEKINPRNM
ncbi:MAG: hypothetical protein WC438_00110 [Candidatus Pacearchaeota archaeon]